MEENTIDPSVRFIENVRALVRGRTFEFERECGVCRNYLYMSHTKQTKGISLTTALTMAKKLGYTVEELASEDMHTKRQIAMLDERIKTLTEQREKLAK